MHAFLRTWFVGLILGVVAALVLPFTFALYGVPFIVAVGLAITAVVLRPRPAGAAGFLIVVGAGWLLALNGAADQCADTNRLPNTSCQMGDNSLVMMLGWLLLATGAALTAYLVTSRRTKASGHEQLHRG